MKAYVELEAQIHLFWGEWCAPRHSHGRGSGTVLFFDFDRWKIKKLADWSTGCDETARGGCSFAWNFSVIRSTVLT